MSFYIVKRTLLINKNKILPQTDSFVGHYNPYKWNMDVSSSIPIDEIVSNFFYNQGEFLADGQTRSHEMKKLD